MDLYTAGHRRGIAAAPHHAAAETGRLLLAEGGTAPAACGRGRGPPGRARAVRGAGPAGAKATPAFYREHGHDTIPPRGPLAALTVPGAVATRMPAPERAEEP